MKPAYRCGQAASGTAPVVRYGQEDKDCCDDTGKGVSCCASEKHLPEIAKQRARPAGLPCYETRRTLGLNAWQAIRVSGVPACIDGILMWLLFAECTST